MEIIAIVLGCGFFIAFILSFAMGANDVANSFGTAVGSKILTLRQAVIIAAIFETLGSVLVGYQVTDTVRKGIVDISIYEASRRQTLQLAFGALATLASSCLWLFLATWRKLPVSASHAIVGATLGFTLVLSGTTGIRWQVLGFIILSWFVSPILAGLVSAALYVWTVKRIMMGKNPILAGLQALPYIYAVTIFINALAILWKGPKLFYLDNLPKWLVVVVSLVVAAVTGVVVKLLLMPARRRFRKHGTLRRLHLEASGTEMTKNSDGRRGSDTNQLFVSSQKQRQQAGDTVDGVIVMSAILPDIIVTTASSTEVFNEHQTSASAADATADDAAVAAASAVVEEVNDEREEIDFTSLTTLPKVGEPTPSIVVDPLTTVTSVIVTSTTKTTSSSAQFLPESPSSSASSSSNSCSIHDLAHTTATNTKMNSITTVDAVDVGGAPSDLLPPLERSPSRKSFTGSVHGSIQMLRDMSTQAINYIRPPPQFTEDHPETKHMFGIAQVLTACCASFAHGGNDVSNAVGPLVTIWLIYETGSGSAGSEVQTPLWILFFGGVGISLGLSIFGRRVIDTIGKDLTAGAMTPSSGFCISLGTVATVLLATKIGVPVSTTHCIVGSVVAVGAVRSSGNVDMKLFKDIALSWFVTLPATVAFSAAMMFALRLIFPHLLL